MHASDSRTGRLAAGGLLLAACLLATSASAQTAGSEGLSPTLANIKRTHVVRLGYRESSPPFSFLDQSNRPIGYSLELCEAIVEEIGVEVDDANLKIEYVKVTSDDRIPAVTENKIDLECGSTTANAERAQAGRVLAADVRGRHQADGAEGVDDLGVDRSQGQDGGGDQGHHQRAGDARRRQEILARASTSSPRPTTSSPTRCWPTARPMPSPPTTSCSTA